MVIEKVMKYHLNMTFGPLPEHAEGEFYFFTHNSNQAIATPSSFEEAEEMLPEIIEYGLIDNSPILNLEDSLMQVCRFTL